MSDGCPFCGRVKRGEYDYDDRWSVAFQPLNPVTSGHFLVVPRKHTASALTSPAATGRAMRFAAELAHMMGLDDFNLITSAGGWATQTVFHLHCHVVPRRPDDGLALPWTGQKERQAHEEADSASQAWERPVPRGSRAVREKGGYSPAPRVYDLIRLPNAPAGPAGGPRHQA